MAYFGLMQLCFIAYTLIKDMNYHCAKFYTNMSTNMDSTNIFPFLVIFAQNFTIARPAFEDSTLALSPPQSVFGVYQQATCNNQ